MKIKKIKKFFFEKILWRGAVLNLEDLFEKIQFFEYSLIKFNTPYMPKDFPINYPVGKDLDIFTSEKDFDAINSLLLDFSRDYDGFFDIVIKRSENKFRVRFEKSKVLHFQLDNNKPNAFNLSSGFLTLALNSRKKIKKFNVLDERFELVFRFSEYLKSPKKKYHMDYIFENEKSIDFELFDKEGLSEKLYSHLEFRRK